MICCVSALSAELEKSNKLYNRIIKQQKKRNKILETLLPHYLIKKYNSPFFITVLFDSHIGNNSLDVTRFSYWLSCIAVPQNQQNLGPPLLL